MTQALADVWPYVAELFEPHAVELRAGVDSRSTRADFDRVIAEVLGAARLDLPQGAPLARVSGLAGRDGVHTEAMGFLLAEMQSVARAHPEATW
jgi:ring-1,2-phenylacetyl-CoA epoxidase subunit PaaC